MTRRCPHCKAALTRDFILKAASSELSRMYANGERDEIWEYLPQQLGVGLAASITSRLRTVFKGQEPVIRACPRCNEKFSAREMRAHKPRCPKNPKFTGKTRTRACPKCSKRMLVSALPDHLRDCTGKLEKRTRLKSIIKLIKPPQ